MTTMSERYQYFELSKELRNLLRKKTIGIEAVAYTIFYLSVGSLLVAPWIMMALLGTEVPEARWSPIFFGTGVFIVSVLALECYRIDRRCIKAFEKANPKYRALKKKYEAQC